MADIFQYPTEFPSDADVGTDITQSVIQQVTCQWIPDMNASWSVDYGTDGTSGMVQSWVAPRNELLPLALRQLLSWNRTMYGNFVKFYDRRTGYLPPRPLVPVSARLTPMLTNNTPPFLARHMQAEGSTLTFGYPCNGAPDDCPNGAFPVILTDKYRVDITWAADEFTNRMGINYAKVEIEPSIRLESVTGANLGVVPLKADGTPKLDANAQTEINRVTTGFPFREPQILIKVSYPWVRLTGPAPSIQNAGPIGFGLSDATSTPPPGKLPEGQYLGCVNNKWFLGFPKGRVLYQSAELTERVSPVTNRLGYQITHVFLVMTTSSWNETRYSGDLANANIQTPNADADDPYWPFGVTVALKKDGAVYKRNDTDPIYPYVHKDFDRLLYYGTPGQPAPPTDEA